MRYQENFSCKDRHNKGQKWYGPGNGNPLQYSCLENSMGRGAWQATVYGAKKSQTQLSD